MKRIVFAAIVAGGLMLSYALPGYAWHGGHFRGSIWIGPGWDPWWGPSYSYNYYPYYSAPPVVIEQAPEEYIQKSTSSTEDSNYWYYCQNPEGYYPYIRKCPDGWKKVDPSPVPPDERE